MHCEKNDTHIKLKAYHEWDYTEGMLCQVLRRLMFSLLQVNDNIFERYIKLLQDQEDSLGIGRVDESVKLDDHGGGCRDMWAICDVFMNEKRKSSADPAERCQIMSRA